MRAALLLVIAAISLGCGSESPVSPPEPPIGQEPLRVSTVTVRTDTAPGSVTVLASGGAHNACTNVGAITQARKGNVIDVGIQTVWDPQAFCILVLKNLDVAVTLQGPFPPGEYVVRVNGVEARFQI